jgi:hypothetical protein
MPHYGGIHVYWYFEFGFANKQTDDFFVASAMSLAGTGVNAAFMRRLSMPSYFLGAGGQARFTIFGLPSSAAVRNLGDESGQVYRPLSCFLHPSFPVRVITEKSTVKSHVCLPLHAACIAGAIEAAAAAHFNWQLADPPTLISADKTRIPPGCAAVGAGAAGLAVAGAVAGAVGLAGAAVGAGAAAGAVGLAWAAVGAGAGAGAADLTGAGAGAAAVAAGLTGATAGAGAPGAAATLVSPIT